MSQPEDTEDTVDVEFRPAQVIASIDSLLSRQGASLQNFSVMKDNMLEAALLHSGEACEKDPAQLAALRAELLKLVEVEREVNAHQRALQELKQNYQPSLERTDFGTVLEEGAKRDMEASRFNAATSEAVKEFDENAGQEAEAGPGSDDLDEDGVMLMGGEQNLQCPISGKDVMLLTDPVEDSKGYVYSKEAIIAHFNRRSRIPCPVAGTGHHITVAELKPAKKILKAQRRARLAGPSQGRQGTQRQADVVLEA